MTVDRGERDAGGPIIGLVGGWSFPAEMFRPLAGRLSSREIRCHDWRGFADAWLGETSAASPTGGTWLGWSLGGGLLLEAVARGRMRPDRLLLVSATPRFLAAGGWPGVSRGEWRALRRAARADSFSAACGFRRRFGLPDCHELPPAAAADPDGLDWLAAIDRRDLLESLPNPVEVWLADDDPLIPSEWAERLTLPRSVVLRRLPGTGHGAIFESWDELARALAPLEG